MLAVDSGHRKRKIGSTLVKRAIDAMIAEEADEVTKIPGFSTKSQIRTKLEIELFIKIFVKLKGDLRCLTKVSRNFFRFFFPICFRDNLYNFKLRKN